MTCNEPETKPAEPFFSSLENEIASGKTNKKTISHVNPLKMCRLDK